MGHIFKKILLVIVLLISSSCSNLIYYPDRYLWGDPRAHGVDFHEFYSRSFDGTRLLFWELKAPESTHENFVVMFHGNAQNMSAHIFNLLWLAKTNADILTFDYRGYGLSEGMPYPKGIVEDGLKALQIAYTKFKAGKYKHFIIYGQSLGGMVALRALQETTFNSEINLLVLDSTFRDPQQVAKSKVGPFGYLISGEYAAQKNLAHITMPTLIIHNEQDPVVNIKFGDELYNTIPAKDKTYWKINTGLHGDIFFVDNGKYRKEFLELKALK